MKDRLTDTDLGLIVFVRNNRAKRLIVRKMEDHYKVTIPFDYTIQQAVSVLQSMKSKLLTLKARPVSRFHPDTEFKTFSFSLKLIRSNSLRNYYMNLKDGILSISCPQNCDFDDDATQVVIRNLVEKALRYEAKRIFHEKVELLARQYGFIFSEVKINKSRTRWGSCSSKKSINLSYMCMLLPEYLADFVILHELCHTVEMNHSSKFWNLLDKVTDNKAKELTEELKKAAINL